MKIAQAHDLLKRWEEKEDSPKRRVEAAMKKNGELFHPENIRHITEKQLVEQFQNFLSFKKGNHHWHGLQRHPESYDDPKKLRNSLTILLDESRNIEARLDDLTRKDSPNRVKGLREAVLTPILMCVYRDEYAVYNSISVMALRELEGKLGPLEGKGTFGQRYFKLNEKCKDLSRFVGGKHLWLIDVMFSLMLKNSRA